MALRRLDVAVRVADVVGPRRIDRARLWFEHNANVLSTLVPDISEDRKLFGVDQIRDPLNQF